MENSFSERLIQVRQNKGLTQKQMADKLGVTAQAVSKWETKGSLPDMEMAKAIAILLDCSIDYLVGHEVTEESRINLLLAERREQIERELSKEALAVQIGTGLIDMFLAQKGNNWEKMHRLRMELASTYGIYVPTVRFMDAHGVAEKEYAILIYETKEVFRDTLTDTSPDTGMDIIMNNLRRVILEYFSEWINTQVVADMVEVVRKRYPAVTEGVVPEQVSYVQLKKVISELVMRGCPVNRLDYIIEYIAEGNRDLEQLKNMILSWQSAEYLGVPEKR